MCPSTMQLHCSDVTLLPAFIQYSFRADDHGQTATELTVQRICSKGFKPSKPSNILHSLPKSKSELQRHQPQSFWDMKCCVPQPALLPGTPSHLSHPAPRDRTSCPALPSSTPSAQQGTHPSMGFALLRLRFLSVLSQTTIAFRSIIAGYFLLDYLMPE